MKKVWIVMKETYLRQVKSLAFVFMVFAPFLFMGLSFGGGFIGASAVGTGSDQVAIISSDKTLTKQVIELGDYTDEIKDEAEAKKALESEEIAGYLTLAVTDNQIEAVYHGTEEMDRQDQLVLSQVLADYQEKLNQSEANLTSEQTNILSRQYIFTQELAEDKAFEKIGQMISFFMIVMFMYIILVTYSSLTAQEIANEKGTKIMEVIFSSVPAPLYFYGKLLGILAVIATHIGIYAIGGFIAYRVAMSYAAALGLSEMVQTIIGTLSINSLLFIIFGLFIYVVFAALCGSLVTRLEDVNKAVSPVMMVIMVAFFGAMFLGQAGNDHLIMKIGSFVPFLSTFFMPIRVINDDATSIEAWISLGILVTSSFALVYIIGRSYAGLILQTDDIGLWKSFKKGITSR